MPWTVVCMWIFSDSFWAVINCGLIKMLASVMFSFLLVYSQFTEKKKQAQMHICSILIEHEMFVFFFALFSLLCTYVVIWSVCNILEKHAMHDSICWRISICSTATSVNNSMIYWAGLIGITHRGIIESSQKCQCQPTFIYF